MSVAAIPSAWAGDAESGMFRRPEARPFRASHSGSGMVADRWPAGLTAVEPAPFGPIR